MPSRCGASGTGPSVRPDDPYREASLKCLLVTSLNREFSPLALISRAIAVLEALNTKQMIEQAKAKGLWTPGEGKTPEQTLYSAIAREIKAKGENSRFKLVTKGHFKLASR